MELVLRIALKLPPVTSIAYRHHLLMSVTIPSSSSVALSPSPRRPPSRPQLDKPLSSRKTYTSFVTVRSCSYTYYKRRDPHRAAHPHSPTATVLVPTPGKVVVTLDC